jgi:ABC-type metal ion transport system, periplasmic component/surface adhesin
MRRRQGCAATVVALLLAAACGGGGGGDGAAGADGRPQVVAAFYPLFEAAQRVGGDRVDVVNLTQAGTEPHDLELTPRQVDLIEGADLVLYLGGGFQPGVEEVAERSEGEAIDAMADLTLLPGVPDEHEEEAEGEEHAGESGMDPHVWLDPRLLARMVERVEAALARDDAGGKAAYASNSEAYRRELGLLDDEFGKRLATCQRRVIVTAHAAFGYLARRYGITQEPIAGFSPESEPDPKRLAELAELVRSTGTTTIFTETLVSPRVAETLAREAGVTTAVLNPIEGLTQDELGKGETYVSVMKQNLAVLAEALGCGADR